MTGRARGYCAGHEEAGYSSPDTERGRGIGFGRGRRGRGRGFWGAGRGYGRWLASVGLQPFSRIGMGQPDLGAHPEAGPDATRDERIEALKKQANLLTARIEIIQRQVVDLSAPKTTES